MRAVIHWWREGYIVRLYADYHKETFIAIVTLLRVFSLAVTVTEVGGVHLGFTVRVFHLEASLGCALWDRAY